ncbi:hypothetical protein [Hymenobacter lucidus]|uniref:Uncharacterized protein n=1 Tax=Hymenobacter lucidus TaxID=2880930 RepID=A0ABS8ANH5_9BACT|nr:hypothetical protein [Hymenobacter lucidus]MCB2407654.1 hypothetical protein [Hymenobacter lucidus]
MLKLLATLALLLAATTAQACAVCRPRVEAAIHAPDYTDTLLLLLLPVALLVGGVLLLFFSPTLFSWKPTPPRSTVAP